MTLDEFIVAALASRRFFVDDLGRIFNADIRRSGRRAEIIGQVTRDGYLRSTWRFCGEKRSVLHHRAVAIAFLGAPPFDGVEVNHIDGNKRNNSPRNLEWVSTQQNIDHSWVTGLRSLARSVAPVGEANFFSRLLVGEVRAMHRLIASGAVDSQIAAEFNVDKSTVNRIRTGRTWPHIYAEFHPDACRR